MRVTLSESINPNIDTQILPRCADIARNASKNMPEAFPNVVDAVKDYQNSIYVVVNEISSEYNRMFENEEENTSSPMNVTSQTSIKS